MKALSWKVVNQTLVGRMGRNHDRDPNLRAASLKLCWLCVEEIIKPWEVFRTKGFFLGHMSLSRASMGSKRERVVSIVQHRGHFTSVSKASEDLNNVPRTVSMSPFNHLSTYPSIYLMNIHSFV
jgi:hypothetical protein